jgi:predicted transcriptional regulator
LIRPPEIPGFTSSESLGRIKAPAEFRDLLKAIKKENPGSTIPER